MREILFRGKSISGDWVYGSLVQVKGECIIIPEDAEHWGGAEFNVGHCVDPVTVGQCTGLKDKNGKRIFEGDIVQMSDGKCGIIVYDDRCAGYGCGLHGDGCWLCVSEEKDRLVIGNIHDNPELVEV